jgi:hypothetical protein
LAAGSQRFDFGTGAAREDSHFEQPFVVRCGRRL